MVAEFLRRFPQYNHASLYFTPYRKGGVTLDQIIYLLELDIKREREQYMFLASIHGIDTSKLKSKEEREKEEKEYNPNEPLFGDPEMYAKMSEAEKKEATDRLKAKLKKTGLPIKNS